MTRIMYDSTVISRIPVDSKMVACYEDGSYDNYAAAIKAFPHAQVIRVDVNGSNPFNSDVLDYEPGDVQALATVVQWVRAKHLADSKSQPTIYVNRSELIEVVTAVSDAGFELGKDWFLWVSTLDGTWKQYIPVTGVAAVQYTGGVTAAYDTSVVLLDEWHPAPVVVPAPVKGLFAWVGDHNDLVSRYISIPRDVWDAIS